MAVNSTTLPALSPSQREVGTARCEWTGARAGPGSSCSTAISDSNSSDSESEHDHDKELAREFGPADVDWLLGAMSEEQKVDLDQTLFHRECQRIFRIMDEDDSGFLDPQELEAVVAHLIPEPHKAISADDGQRLMLSIRSVLCSFDKDSDRQLSSDEFPDFVRFCYAWRSQQEKIHADGEASDVLRPASRGRQATAALPCGAAHRLVRSASAGFSGLSPPSSARNGNLPPRGPLRLPQTMNRSASNPTVRPSTSSGSSKPPVPRGGASSRFVSPEPRASSSSSSRRLSRSRSASCLGSVSSSRRPSKSSTSQSNASSRRTSPEPAPRSKPSHRDDLGVQQMRALKALLRDLVKLHTSLPALISVLMHNIMAPDNTQAFSKDTLDHVCDIVMQASKERFSPRSYGPVSTTSELAACMHLLGHVAADPDSEIDQATLLVDRAIEVVLLLSLRWLAIKHHASVPEMSDYQKHKWMPPAFSYLVGQTLWRHRAADALSAHKSAVENLHWITAVPGIKEDMIDNCNAVFEFLSGSRSNRMKVTQWRRVMELIALNPELRQRVRRCDAVRACYGDALGQAEAGMSRRSFKLMLVKTADLMNVHPVVLFQELASRACDLGSPQKLLKDAA